MAVKYPYVASPGPLTKAITQFRKSLPASITSATLKKLGIAPNNETYVINTLRFLGLIDEDGTTLEPTRKLFTNHADEAFGSELSGIVRNAYASLFELRGDDAWTLPKDELITFFRNDDQSTEIVGTRQATTFATLAALSGRRTDSLPAERPPVPRASNVPKSARKKTSAAQPMNSVRPQLSTSASGASLGLAVRIELVLPASTDQAVYDTIFRSIRENFIDGNGS